MDRPFKNKNNHTKCISSAQYLDCELEYFMHAIRQLITYCHSRINNKSYINSSEPENQYFILNNQIH